MEESSLTKVSALIRSEKSIVLIVIFCFVILSLTVYTLINRQKQIIPKNQIAYHQRILPGITSEKDLIDELGQPKSSKDEPAGKVYSFPTTNEKRDNEVLTKSDKVILIKEQIIKSEKGMLNEYINRFGEPEAILYGKHSFAAPAYVWGQKGILIFGNPQSGLVAEIWYFEPQPASEFILKYPEFKNEPEQKP